VEYPAAIYRAPTAWSAEFRIAESLIGGWNHAAGLMIEHGATNWPPFADPNRPVSWAPVYFGTNPPPPSNRAPVAQAGAAQRVSLISTQTLYLDGSASFDPEGSPLTFNWTQVGGPSVSLQQSNTATPFFVGSPVTSPTTFSFQLVVNDGAADSAPSQAQITLLPPPQQQQMSATPASQIRLRNDGTLQIRLIGQPGGLYQLQASSDLKNWQALRLIYADFIGRIEFEELIDPVQYPIRFFRAVKSSGPGQ